LHKSDVNRPHLNKFAWHCFWPVRKRFSKDQDQRGRSKPGCNNKWRWWTIAAYRRTHSPSQLAWSEGRQPLGAILHSSDEPDELSK